MSSVTNNAIMCAFGRRIEPSKTPDTTFIWAEFWNCDHCGNHLEKREERPWPTHRDMITKRLLKVATDYEQVKAFHLEVEHARIVLTLELHSWHIVEVLRSVEAAHTTGFYRASDLYRLEQYGVLTWPLDENHRFPRRPLTKPEQRNPAFSGLPEKIAREYGSLAVRRANPPKRRPPWCGRFSRAPLSTKSSVFNAPLRVST